VTHSLVVKAKLFVATVVNVCVVFIQIAFPLFAFNVVDVVVAFGKVVNVVFTATVVKVVVVFANASFAAAILIVSEPDWDVTSRSCVQIWHFQRFVLKLAKK
jgi:hypothetical protein